MRKPFRVLIAVPCTDYMHADFVRSLMNLTNHLNREGIRHDTEIRNGSLICYARNELARKTINEGYTHILFIDSDMVFDENIVETLTFCEKEFVCGAFQSRRPPYRSCVYSSLDPVQRVERYGAAPFRVQGCGMAMTLIGAEILKAVQEKHGDCFNPERMGGIYYGEDLAFCVRARGVGAEIWCEPTARVGHIAHKTIWPGEEN